jgi:hypothetical protein
MEGLPARILEPWYDSPARHFDKYLFEALVGIEKNGPNRKGI